MESVEPVNFEQGHLHSSYTLLRSQSRPFDLENQDTLIIDLGPKVFMVLGLMVDFAPVNAGSFLLYVILSPSLYFVL